MTLKELFEKAEQINNEMNLDVVIQSGNVIVCKEF